MTGESKILPPPGQSSTPVGSVVGSRSGESLLNCSSILDVILDLML